MLSVKHPHVSSLVLLVVKNLSFLAIFLFGASRICAQSAEETSTAEPSLPEIHTLNEFWQIAENARLRDLPHVIALEFTALYYDPVWNLLWVDDGSGVGSYMPLDGNLMPFVSGQHVAVAGELIPSSGFNPKKLTFRVIKESAYPELVELSEQVSSAERHDLNWVTIDGYVDRQYKPDESHFAYDLIVQNRRIEVRILANKGEAILELEGRFARFEGLFVVTPGQGAESVGLAVWSPNVSYAEEISSPLAELFESSPVAISDLDLIDSGRGVRISAVVYSQDPGHLLTVRDSTGLLKLSTQQALPLELGMGVEIVGYPNLESLSWTLSNAVYRPLASSKVAALDDDSESVLRLSEQVLNLDLQVDSRSHPVALDGVVTFADPDQLYLYINDNTGGVLVKFDEPWTQTVPVGNAISIEGLTEKGGFTPVVRASYMKVLGSVSMPVSSKVTYEQAMTGIEEARWIEMSGHFRYSTSWDGWTDLSLASATGEFTVRVPTPDEDFEMTAGSILSVRGVCVAESNESRELVGFNLYAPSVDYISIDAVAPKDPFELPVSSVAGLRRYNSQRMSNQQFRMQGTVLHHVPGHFMFVSDGENSLYVLSRSLESLAVGDEVDVVGFPGRIGPRFVFRDSVYRKTGQGVVPVALPITMDSQVDPKLHGRVVNLSGELFDIVVGNEESRMLLRNNGFMVEVILKKEFGALEESSWQKGSTLAIRGIYFVGYDEYGHANGFSLILHDTRDVEVLKTPSWWNAKHAVIAASVLAGALVLGLFWAFMLRSRVTKQTALIQTQVEEQALLIQQNKQVFDSASDFIYTLDLDGRFTSFNPAGEIVTGYTAEDAKSMTVYDMLEGRDARMVRMVLRRRRTRAESRTIVNQLIRRDGQRIWVETGVRFLREGDETKGIFCIMRDITARKLVEEELKCARDAAEANTKAKSAFFATMSHELRTPMNGVIGMTNVLLDTNLDNDQRDYASTVRDSAESLLVLLNDILDLSKAEAGKLTIEPHDFDLKETVERSAALLDAAASDKKIALVTLFAPGTPFMLTGDSGRLRQVLLNLAGNAIKFTEKGQVGIAVSKISETDEDALLKFEISDTGIGISEEAKMRLFKPFEQADGSHSRRFGGTGLGLAICKQIVELMGGEIGVDSVPGEGSTFWFTVKLAKVEGMEPASVKPLKKKSASKKWTGPAYKILMAEDMPVNQKVTRLQLKKLGLTADLAENGLEVLEAVKTKPYDIILMDCQMPEMDGFEATEKLRSNSEYAGIHIIALTANAMEGDRKRCLDSGMDDFVSKPTRPDALLAAFERYAGKVSGTL